MTDTRILIAAGGTGGHVYPAIAIADALKEYAAEPPEIAFAGTRDRMEWRTVPKAGYEIFSIWITGIERRLSVANLLFPLKLLVSLIQSWLLLRRLRPDAVIACGGFASGPVGWMAARMRIPLVIQEQNSYPGLTTRKLASHAEVVFMGFEDAAEYLPSGRSEFTGNPVRTSLLQTGRREAGEQFALDPETRTLLVLGGSGGAESVNRAMMVNLSRLHDELGVQVLWVCGERYFDTVRSKVEPERYPNLRLYSYIDKMAEAYAVADLAVSRAGALSCAELMLTGTPSVLVPSPNVAGDHQARNARSMVRQHAAELLPDGQVEHQLYVKVSALITDEQRLQQMSEAARRMARPDAARNIAERVLGIISNRSGVPA